MRLGIEIEPADPAEAITEQEAIDAAEGHYSYGQDPTVDRDAFLGRVTDPRTEDTDEPIFDRPIWIIRYSGIEQEHGGPMQANGTPSAGRTFHVAYVFIDAETGS